MNILKYIIFGLGGPLALGALIAEFSSDFFSNMIRNKKDYGLSYTLQIQSILDRIKNHK